MVAYTPISDATLLAKKALTQATLRQFRDNDDHLKDRLNDVQIFTASGTWVKKEGVTKVLARLWAGGGSGAVNVNAGAGGGSGGQYIEAWFDAVDLPATVAVAIGAGGLARSGSNGVGFAGGDTTFNNLTAKGGFGGNRGGVDTVKTAGGSGGPSATGAITRETGGAGGGVVAGVEQPGANSAFSGAGGGGAYIGGALGGFSVHGGNGGFGADGATAGGNGFQPGGGGGGQGGTGGNHTSGTGAAGQVIVISW